MASNTSAGPNGGILIGDIVINELMYKPISGNDDDQYVELLNKGGSAVNLAGRRMAVSNPLRATVATAARFAPLVPASALQRTTRVSPFQLT